MRKIALLVCLTLCTSVAWAAGEAQQAVTKETVLNWVTQHKDVKADFKPGDVLKADELHKLRPFIPPGYFEEFQFPTVAFEIAPTGDYPPHQAYRDATEKFAGQTRLRDDGSLDGYMAGQPFANDGLDPGDPSAGLKAGWNFNFRWQHYGPKSIKFVIALIGEGGTLVPPPGVPADVFQGGGTLERLMAQQYQRVYFTHVASLADQGYTLAVPDAAQFEWKDIQEWTEPYDMRGQRVLIQRASDPLEADQAWTYVPNLRRVRRISAEEKSDSYLGTDTTLDDFYGFSGRVLDYTWKFHGWKDVLHVMNSKHAYARFYGPHSRVPDDRWEVRRALVVEQSPKNPNHPYSSKILFIDAQTYRVASALAFDRDGRLWKIFLTQNAWSEDAPTDAAMNKGTFLARYMGGATIDVQKGQASVYPIFGADYPDVEPAEAQELYDVNRLTEGRR